MFVSLCVWIVGCVVCGVELGDKGCIGRSGVCVTTGVGRAF